MQRGDRNARSPFVGELLTGQRIQHPGRDGHLHVIRELDDHAISRIAPEPPDDFYVFAVKRMVTVVNDGGGRFMSSVRMRCATPLPPICSRWASTWPPFNACSATAQIQTTMRDLHVAQSAVTVHGAPIELLSFPSLPPQA